jgi:hypothetical protein
VHPREDKADLPRLFGTNGIDLDAIKTALVNDPGTKTPRLHLSVANLLRALWLSSGKHFQAARPFADTRIAARYSRLVRAPVSPRRRKILFRRPPHHVILVIFASTLLIRGKFAVLSSKRHYNSI